MKPTIIKYIGILIVIIFVAILSYELGQRSDAHHQTYREQLLGNFHPKIVRLRPKGSKHYVTVRSKR